MGPRGSQTYKLLLLLLLVLLFDLFLLILLIIITIITLLLLLVLNLLHNLYAERDPVLIERSNLVNISKLVVKEVRLIIKFTYDCLQG